VTAILPPPRYRLRVTPSLELLERKVITAELFDEKFDNETKTHRAAVSKILPSIPLSGICLASRPTPPRPRGRPSSSVFFGVVRANRRDPQPRRRGRVEYGAKHTRYPLTEYRLFLALTL
jgi:hypothetical protein